VCWVDVKIEAEHVEATDNTVDVPISSGYGQAGFFLLDFRFSAK
jgi:hypothetical protein